MSGSASIIGSLPPTLFRSRSGLGALSALGALWVAWLLTLPPRPATGLILLSGLPLLAVGSWLSRPAGEAWLAFARRTGDVHGLALVLLAALGVQFEDAHGVTTDGVIYFTQLRSVLFDGDLNLAAEFAFLGQPSRPYHVVPIGPTLVWLPLYLLVAGVDAIGRATALWPAPSEAIALGLTLPYVRAALISSFAIGSVGLVAVHLHLRHEFTRGVTFGTTLLLLGATPLVWYMVYEPAMTHAASFGFVALFVVAASRFLDSRQLQRIVTKEPGPFVTSGGMVPRTLVDIRAGRAVLLGALLGLAFITRPQEALFALFPAVLILTSVATWRVRVTAAARLAVWALVGAAPLLALQAVHTAILLSRESVALVGSGAYVDLFRSRWADTLWSSWHGWLTWTPVVYLALLGTLAYARRHWRWTAASLLILFSMAWLNGATADWAAGWSFGGRRFTSSLVLIAPGLALLLRGLSQRPMIALWLLAAAAVAWNQLLVAQRAEGIATTNAPLSFGQIIRQQAALATRPPFVYPFAFPANAWFAWRTGLPLDRYDLLGPEPLWQSIDLAFDQNATRYLLDGWGTHAVDTRGQLRWIDGGRAGLVLPLDPPLNGNVEVRIAARSRLLDPPRRAVIALSVNDRRIGTFTPEAVQPSTATLLVDSGLLVRGFNRIHFEQVAVVDASGAAVTTDQPLPTAVYRLTVGRSAPDP